MGKSFAVNVLSQVQLVNGVHQSFFFEMLADSTAAILTAGGIYHHTLRIVNAACCGIPLPPQSLHSTAAFVSLVPLHSWDYDRRFLSMPFKRARFF